MHKNLMRLSLGICLALGTACSLFAQPAVNFFPGRKIYPAYRADALAHQLSLTRVTDNREWIGVIGGALPLIDVVEEGILVQMGMGASVFNRIIKTPGHITVYTVDYRLDIPVDIMFPAFTLRVGYGHISNHFADDGIEILGLRSISAVKDYVQIGLAREVAAVGGTVYVHATCNYHNEPLHDRRWILQCGGDFGHWALAPWISLYGAFDLKIKEEVNWGSTQSYQAGCILVPKGEYAVRLAYTFRTGYEERGQLFTQSRASNLVSLFIDF